jgi:hypothetical protein
MGIAFETAIQALRNRGVFDPPREAIARAIIGVAKAGERDPERLCDLALEASAKPIITDPNPASRFTAGFLNFSQAWQRFVRSRYVMEHYLVELDGDQVELLRGMVREAIKVADEKEVPALEALLSALGIMKWKAGDRRAD